MAVRLGYDAPLLAAISGRLALAVMQDMRHRVKQQHGLASVAALHAGVFTAVQRKALPGGRVRVSFKAPWRSGTAHADMDAHQFARILHGARAPLRHLLLARSSASETTSRTRMRRPHFRQRVTRAPRAAARRPHGRPHDRRLPVRQCGPTVGRTPCGPWWGLPCGPLWGPSWGYRWGPWCGLVRLVVRLTGRPPPTAGTGELAPEPDLGWASGGVATRSVERRPLEFVAVGEVAAAGGVAMRRDNRVNGSERRRPGAGRWAPHARRPPRRRSPSPRRAARRDTAVWPASRPRRRPRRRRADARWPARWSPAFHGAWRTRRHLPPWGPRGGRRQDSDEASREAPAARRIDTAPAPARNLPWSRRVRAPCGRVYIASAPGAKSPLVLVLAAVRSADGAPATGARV